MKRASKKVFPLLFCMLFFFCLMPQKAYAAEQQLGWIETLYVTGIYGENTLPEQKVNWQYANKGRYLCLPAGSELNNVKIYFMGDVESDGYIMVNGTKVKSGDTINLTQTLNIQLADNMTEEVTVVQSANIPSVFIQTESGTLDRVHASKENKESGTMAIVKSDKSIDFDGELKHIKGRGNSTWDFAKKPYNIKLKSSSNLLEMGKAKGWCLLANYTDRSLLRNRIIYDLAEEVGIPFTMDSRNIDLYINGDYMGSYLLTEKVEIDKNRVNITDLEKATEGANNDADLSTYAAGGTAQAKRGTQKWVNIPNDPEDITGGYLIEMELSNRYEDEACGFVTTGGQAVVMKAPEYVSENQIKYISSFYQKIEDALYSKDGYMTDANGTRHHFSEFIDVESLARMYLLQEFGMNLDSGITSFYFYKESDAAGDGKLHAAPAWDFDVALGNYAYRNNVNLQDPTQWYAKIAKMYDDSSVYNVMAQAVQHETVWNKVKELWQNEFMPAIKVFLGETTNYQPTKIKSLSAYQSEVNASAAMNFLQYHAQMEKPEWYTNEGFVDTGRTYAANIEYIRNFASQRRNFLNSNLASGGTEGGGTEGGGNGGNETEKPESGIVEISDDTCFKAAENIVTAYGDVRPEDSYDVDGGQSLGYCNAKSYVEYQVKVLQSGTYDLSVRLASKDGTGAFEIYMDGQKVTEVSAFATGDWLLWKTSEKQTISLTAGQHTMRIAFTESGMNLNWLQFTKTVATNPDPEPTPNPNPTPNPDPTPNPNPTPDPDPTPNPNPTPDPDPTPNPNPTPGNQVVQVPLKGGIYEDAAGLLQYRITKADAVNGTVEVAGILKKRAKVTIPTTVVIGGITFKVTGIGKRAFENNKSLKNIVIGANVTSIADKGFTNCKKLSVITFKGQKAPSIKKAAFKGIKKKIKVQYVRSLKKSELKKLKKRMKAAAPSIKITYKKTK